LIDVARAVRAAQIAIIGDVELYVGSADQPRAAQSNRRPPASVAGDKQAAEIAERCGVQAGRHCRAAAR